MTALPWEDQDCLVTGAAAGRDSNEIFFFALFHAPWSQTESIGHTLGAETSSSSSS